MPVNYTAATVDAVVSVWVKLPEEVRGKVIEVTNRLIDISKELSEDTTGRVRGNVEEYFGALSPEVFKGVRDTFKAIAENTKE